MVKRQEAQPKSENSSTQVERRKRFSKLMVQPTTNAAVSIAHLHRQIHFGEPDDKMPVKGLDTLTLMNEMEKTSKQIRSGNLQPLEEILLAQAATLDAVFHRYLHQMDSAEYLPKLEAYARIAMKAQHQSRQTLATLGELKHPKRATFIKQQNNAVNQQINQGSVQGDSPNKKSENPEQCENKLLEQSHAERLEPGTTQATGGTDPGMATVDKINRTKN